MKQRRSTKQRQLVLDAVRARCDHPSADQIYLDVRAADERISRGTVYRNLKVLVQQGELLIVRTPQADRFEPKTQLHYHVICSRCGEVGDVRMPYMPKLDEQAADETDYQITKHLIIFDGICRKCYQRQASK